MMILEQFITWGSYASYFIPPLKPLVMPIGLVYSVSNFVYKVNTHDEHPWSGLAYDVAVVCIPGASEIMLVYEAGWKPAVIGGATIGSLRTANEFIYQPLQTALSRIITELKKP